MKSPKAEQTKKDRITVKAIIDVASDVSKRIDKLRKPDVVFPVRSLGNVHYSPKKGYFEIGKDKSVRTLKGPKRPIVPAEERCELLAALACVDFVHPFDELDVGAVLLELRPQVHAKGPDYSPENLPERDVVKEIGAELVIVGGIKDRSVTGLLERIQAL